MKSFLSTNSPRRTFSFGAGREDFNTSCYNKKQYTDPQIPGPGTYTYKNMTVGVNARKNSCHGKLEGFGPAESAMKEGVPGPGMYKDQLALDKVGKYHISTYNNSKASRFNPGNRFKSVQPHPVPGPGTYEQGGLTCKAVQGCSNFHSILTRTLKTTEKQRPEFGGRFKTPGPGTYRPPSDFGYVDNLGSPLSPREFNAQGSMTSTNFEKSARRTHNGSFMKTHSPRAVILQDTNREAAN